MAILAPEMTYTPIIIRFWARLLVKTQKWQKSILLKITLGLKRLDLAQRV